MLVSYLYFISNSVSLYNVVVSPRTHNNNTWVLTFYILNHPLMMQLSGNHAVTTCVLHVQSGNMINLLNVLSAVPYIRASSFYRIHFICYQ